MSACLGGLFGCLSRTLLAVIRALLMFWCILILISQVMSIWAMYTTQDEIMDEYLPGYRVHWHAYLSCVGTGILALIGIHGASTKDPRYLKTFALLAFSLAACYLLLNSDWAERMWAEKREGFADTMEEMARDYEWDLKSNEQKNKATDLWDTIQAGLTCCGLTGAQDWTNNNNFKVQKKDWLPRSCCYGIARAVNRDRPDGKQKCTLEDAYQVGCMQRMDQIVDTFYKRQVVSAVVLLIMACWAFILAKKSQAEAADLMPPPNSVDYTHQWQQGPPPAYYMSSIQPIGAQGPKAYAESCSYHNQDSKLASSKPWKWSAPGEQLTDFNKPKQILS